MTMDEMMNFCIDKMVEVHPEIDKAEASAMMKEVFPKLKRWANDYLAHFFSFSFFKNFKYY
jgi:hypothetical protein